MLTSLDTAINEINLQKAKFVELAKNAFSTAFKEVFTNFPCVTKIRFTGYTPYFNDGDVCEYRLSDVEVQLRADGPLDMTCSSYSCKNVVATDERFCSKCGQKQPTLQERADVWQESWGLKKTNPQLAEVVSSLYRKLCSIEDEVKAVFGDHKQVTVELVGDNVVLDIADYDHE